MSRPNKRNDDWNQIIAPQVRDKFVCARRCFKDAVSDDAGDLSTSSLQGVAPISQYGMCDAPFKMILAVNMSLKMGNGKIAAQCGHATLGCYCKSIKASPTAVGWWERLGQAKIAVKIADENEMFVIRDAADADGGEHRAGQGQPSASRV